MLVFFDDDGLFFDAEVFEMVCYVFDHVAWATDEVDAFSGGEVLLKECFVDSSFGPFPCWFLCDCVDVGEIPPLLEVFEFVEEGRFFRFFGAVEEVYFCLGMFVCKVAEDAH